MNILNGAGGRRWSTLLQQGVRALEEAKVSTPRRTARWLLEEVCGQSAAAIIANPQREASAAQAQCYAESIARCQQHEPLQYVLGYADFCGLRLRVTPDVLIPRPETELLVQAALKRVASRQGARILDIGTGSGCIALALKAARPDLHVAACDISIRALRVAQWNAQALGLAISFAQADVLSDVFDLYTRKPFDCVVSNPPYIPDAEFHALPVNVRCYEPDQALACGSDPLAFYRAIARQGPCLAPLGSLALEVHADYAEQVRRHLAQFGYINIALQRDLAGYLRIITADCPHQKTQTLGNQDCISAAACLPRP